MTGKLGRWQLLFNRLALIFPLDKIWLTASERP